MELKNSFPLTFLAFGINLQKFTIFPTQSWRSRAILSYDSGYIQNSTLISIYHLSVVCHVESFPKCIEHYWFMASRAKKKIWRPKFENIKRWVPLNFLWAKKLLQMVSHELWVRKLKMVFLGKWNPRAWMNFHVLVSTRLTNSGVCNAMEHSNYIVHCMIL